MKVPLSSPDIGRREIELVNQVLSTRYLSIGPMVERFEAAVADYVGTGHAVAVSSGTAGLHLAMAAAGVGPGDEVITTPFSFVASANCILYQGGRPVFADIDPTTLNIDPEGVEAAITSRTVRGGVRQVAVRTATGTTARIGLKAFMPAVLMAEGVAMAVEWRAHRAGHDETTSKRAGDAAGLATSAATFAATGAVAGPVGAMVGAVTGAAVWAGGSLVSKTATWAGGRVVSGVTSLAVKRRRLN